MIKRLRIKFVCINMSIVLLMLCMILGTVLRVNRLGAERESLHMMQTAAFAPHRAQPPGESPNPAARLPCFTLRPGPDGELISEGGHFFDLSDRALLRTLYAQASAGAAVDILPQYRLRYLRLETPAGPCIVFADISGELSAQRRLLVGCLLAGGGSAAAFLLISIALSGWAVRPVGAAWQQQRQFVSDASHELKTPLTVILTNAELLQDVAAPPAQRAEFVENILVMSREMRSLIECLLELARAEGGMTRQAGVPVDLSRLTAQALLPFEPVYFEKGLTLTGTLAQGVTVCGSAPHLRHLLEILLDNAQKYTAPAGDVTVTLRMAGRRHCLLAVSNPGPPLSPAQRRDIFKRFYRVDEARSRDGSYGLGLSIAEAVVRGHRGRIWAESEAGRNTFCVRLPVVRGRR